MQSASSYEDGFEGVDTAVRLRAFPRPGQSKADTKLPQEFGSKIKLSNLRKPSHKASASKLPGEPSNNSMASNCYVCFV